MLLSHCYRLCRLFTAVRVFLWVWEAGATLWLPSSGVASPAAERRLFCPRLQGLPLPGSWAQAQQLRQVGRAALQHAGPSRSRDRTRLSAWAGRFFTTEPPGKPLTPLSKALRLSQGCRGCLTLPLLRVSLKRPDRPAHAQARTATHRHAQARTAASLARASLPDSSRQSQPLSPLGAHSVLFTLLKQCLPLWSSLSLSSVFPTGFELF